MKTSRGWGPVVGSAVRAAVFSALSAAVVAGVCLLILVVPQVASAATQIEPEAPPAVDATGPDAVGPVGEKTSSGEVLVATLDSIVHPAAAEHLIEVLDEADRTGAEAVVLQLSTPGGLITSTRVIATAMLEAQTPVIVYVTPQGAQAASAGFFILMAADVAAMAPSTNTGAAHPVGGQGEDIEGTMGEKIEADTAAWVRSLAGRNQRDEKLAEAAVIESRSFSAQEALDLGLVDFVAPTLPDLLQQADGRVLERSDGQQRTLQLATAQIRPVEPTAFQRVRGALLSPNIAYMLLTLGGLGLWVEISNPGAIFPGVLGAIALLLGLYGTSALPVNIAGVAFLLLAGVLFFAEVKTGGFGVLGFGGVVSVVLGGLMLFESPDPALRVSLDVIVALAAVSVVIVGFLSVLMWRARKNQVRTGEEGLQGERARSRSAFAPTSEGASEFVGKVDLHGEIWNARSSRPVDAGAEVLVERVDGLTVWVRAAG